MNGFKAIWDEAKDFAVAAVNKAKELAVNATNSLKRIAENALAEITSGLTQIGNNIKCARRPSAEVRGLLHPVVALD